MDWKWSLWMTIALITTFVTTLLLVIAFATGYWVETDPCWPIDRISRLGLWNICFDFYYDPFEHFGPNFDGCLLLMDSRLRRHRPELLPPFFVATQVLFSFCVILLILALIILVMLPFKRSWRFPLVFIVMVTMVLSAIFGLLTLAVFGSLAKTFKWVTDVNKVHLSWSYWLAVSGVILEVVSAVFFTLHLIFAVRNESPAVSFTNDPEFLKGSDI